MDPLLPDDPDQVGGYRLLGGSAAAAWGRCSSAAPRAAVPSP
ncbi:hypothetical protein [Actinomadura madurae]|nr:hypothetical protein [Actinomadura madurae]